MEDFNKYTSHINYSPIVDFTLQQGKETSYKKGEYFVRQGEACKIMGFVVSGSFRYCCVNSLGESSIVGYTFDHSFVGNYPAFQLQDQSNVDIQALCDCTVYVINHSQLADFYDINNDHQKLGRRIAETLLWEIYDRMISMYSLTPEERYLDIINRMIDKPGGRSHRVILLGLFATLLQAKGTVRLDRDARPLLLIEDPETRLHPIMLSVAWHLLNLLPLQRVTTTNSGELLSLTPVEQVCRLVRESTRVSAWRLGPGGMNAEESRRIAFHIRFNRASSLFARCWLLVEGETETWVINELARQCGHHFDAEGVKVIEFAQSGLKPLIKFARRMGIQWHVLVDGDEAGKKYAATVRGLLNNDRELERDHLTSLPALDMEHFMYRQGFDDVYHRVAQIPDNVPMNMRRVITKAIHRSSKPDLAIEVAMEAGRRGVDAVPTLLKKMFSRVLWLARGRAD